MPITLLDGLLLGLTLVSAALAMVRGLSRELLSIVSWGAAAVVAMGLGTAVFTLIVATLAVAGRDAAFLAAGDGRAARLLGPGLQIAVGGLIFGIGGTLALAALPL